MWIRLILVRWQARQKEFPRLPLLVRAVGEDMLGLVFSRTRGDGKLIVGDMKIRIIRWGMQLIRNGGN